MRDYSLSDIDRKMPCHLEAEQSVIGAILINPAVLDTVSDIITGDDFYHPEHKALFEIMQSMYLRDKKIDLVTLVNEMRTNEDCERAGGVEYIKNISMIVPTSSHALEYAKIVKAEALRRRLIEVSEELAEAGYSEGESIENLLDLAEAKICAIADNADIVHSDFETAIEGMKGIYAWLASEDKCGLLTGLKTLDDIIQGINPTDFVVIGARPSTGKTSLAMRISLEVALNQRPDDTVMIYSLEMTKEQIWRQLASIKECIDLSELRRLSSFADRTPKEENDYSNMCEALAHGASTISESHIEVRDISRDGATINPAKIRQDIRRHKKPISLIVVDYIQLLASTEKTDSDYERISALSRELKRIAISCKVPILLIAQLSRKGADEPPKMHHLRESGQIEQDADKIIMIDYPQKTKRPLGKVNSEGKQIDESLIFTSRGGVDRVMLRVVKNRGGEIGDAIVQFRGKYTRYEDVEASLWI